MKSILLLASLVVAGVAGPHLIREFYDRHIAVNRSGVPFNQVFGCPACQARSGLHGDVSRPGLSRCSRCGHRWKQQVTTIPEDPELSGNFWPHPSVSFPAR